MLILYTTEDGDRLISYQGLLDNCNFYKCPTAEDSSVVHKESNCSSPREPSMS